MTGFALVLRVRDEGFASFALSTALTRILYPCFVIPLRAPQAQEYLGDVAKYEQRPEQVTDAPHVAPVSRERRKQASYKANPGRNKESENRKEE